MKKLLLLSIVGILAFCWQVCAQSRTISGTVRSATDNLPLPGVNVLVKGSSNGTTTNSDGAYTITAPDNTTLVFSFIGFTPQEVVVGTQSSINIALREEATSLNEVVVTDLGGEREKRSLGYSVQQIGGDAIVNAREPNVINALAGKIAGVQINNSGGQPGSSSRITIRGNSSVLGNNQPLIVIDGIPMDNSQNFGGGQTDQNGRGGGDSPLFNGSFSNRAIDLDPNIVESISVLKGAAASALWGSRAANGVLLITTKKGKGAANRKGPTIALNSTFGWDDAWIAGFQNSYLQGVNKLYRNGRPLSEGGYSEGGPALNPQTSASWGPHRDSVSQAVIDSIGRPGIYDPRDAFYKTGKSYENSISISNGTENYNYLASFTNFTQDGIVPTTNLRRNSILAKFGARLSDKIDVTASVNYVRTDNKRLAEGNGSSSFLYGLNFTPISYDITDSQNPATGEQRNFVATGFNNPFWLANNNGLYSKVDRFISTATITYRPLSWLSITERIGVDTYVDNRKRETNVGTRGTPRGGMYDENIQWRQINSDLIITAEKEFGQDFRASVLVGNNINTRYQNWMLLRGTDLNIPGYYNIQNASTVTGFQNLDQRRLFGVYSQATLEYQRWLFLTLTGRNDWSSTLPTANNSYFYPSVSLGLVFTDLLGLSQNKFFSYGKLRASFAEVGNDAPTYSLTTNYSKSNPSDGQRGNINYPFQGINGFELSNVRGNPNLQPERTREYELGLELQFLQNRLSADVAVYDRRTVNQIYSVPISPATGFVSQIVNAGEIANRGMEVSVNATPVKVGDFTWEVQGIYTKNRSRVVELSPGIETIRLGGFTNPGIFIKAGEPYGVIWGQGLKRNPQGDLLIDEDGLPVLNDALGVIGNIQPDWSGGLRNTFSWKGISLSGLVDVRRGGDIMNMDLFYSTFYGTAKVTDVRGTPKLWEGVVETTGERNTKEIIQSQNYFQNWFSNVDELFIEDGSFVKLRELNLSYSLPQNLIRKTPFQAISFSAIGRNLLISSKFSYKDPEGSLYGNANAQGFYHAVTPGTRSYTLGLRITL